MKKCRLAFGATFAQGKQYLVVSGGLESVSPAPLPTTSTEIFDLAQNKWTTKEDMVEARSAHSLCEVGGGSYIYAFGG